MAIAAQSWVGEALTQRWVPTDPLKWYESCLQRELPSGKLDQARPAREEMDMLVSAMDELHGGRIVEVADILATRLRTVVLRHGNWTLERGRAIPVILHAGDPEHLTRSQEGPGG